MDFETLKSAQGRVLRFSCQSTASVANAVISHNMGLDYHTTTMWSVPEEDEIGWFLPDVIYQCDSQEQYDRIMANVMDYEVAVQALVQEVGA